MMRGASVPKWISKIYLSGLLGFLVAIVWSVATIAWWTFFLAIPLWMIVHFPWRSQSIAFSETSRLLHVTSNAIAEPQRVTGDQADSIVSPAQHQRD